MSTSQDIKSDTKSNPSFSFSSSESLEEFFCFYYICGNISRELKTNLSLNVV